MHMQMMGEIVLDWEKEEYVCMLYVCMQGMAVTVWRQNIILLHNPVFRLLGSSTSSSSIQLERKGRERESMGKQEREK